MEVIIKIEYTINEILINLYKLYSVLQILLKKIRIFDLKSTLKINELTLIYLDSLLFLLFFI